MESFQLNKAIELQSGLEEIGSLPAKTNIYLFRSLPEINQFVLFVAVDLDGVEMTKNERPERITTSPISGYSVD